MPRGHSSGEEGNQDLQIARAAKGTSEASKAQMQTKRGRGKMETQEGRLDAQSPTTTIERSSNPQRMCGPSCHSFCKARGQRYGVLSNGCKFHGLCRQYRRRARHRSRARKEDKADYLQTRDQEQYFKACIKSVLMANPQLQPA